MFEELTSNQVIAAATIGIFLVGLVQLYLNRRESRNKDSAGNTPSPTLFSTADPQIIHATSGVPTLQQLIEGIEIDARRMGVAERLYESGLAQFNRYVNNRDGVIQDSRVEMGNLAHSLSGSDLSRIHRWTGMDGVRTAEGGEGVTGAIIRARIRVDGRLAAVCRRFGGRRCRPAVAVASEMAG